MLYANPQNKLCTGLPQEITNAFSNSEEHATLKQNIATVVKEQKDISDNETNLEKLVLGMIAYYSSVSL